MKRCLFPILLLLLYACGQKAAGPIHIILNKMQHTVVVAGVSPTTLHGIERDSLTLQTWQNLFPVCAIPANTDLQNDQPPIKGTYTIRHNVIVFKPDTPFKAGQAYFARYYRYDERVTTVDLVMHRRQLGKATYTQLIFKW